MQHSVSPWRTTKTKIIVYPYRVLPREGFFFFYKCFKTTYTILRAASNGHFEFYDKRIFICVYNIQIKRDVSLTPHYCSILDSQTYLRSYHDLPRRAFIWCHYNITFSFPSQADKSYSGQYFHNNLSNNFSIVIRVPYNRGAVEFLFRKYLSNENPLLSLSLSLDCK